LIRQPSAARHLPEAADRAPAAEVERFTSLLEQVLQLSGYTEFETARSGSEKTHRLVRRLELRAKDAPVLTGMLRQVLWKLKNPS
jgi:tRNA/rRNA methyltransferase